MRCQGLDRIVLQPAQAELEFRVSIRPDGDCQMRDPMSLVPCRCVSPSFRSTSCEDGSEHHPYSEQQHHH
jgi:hypothetical protein